MNEIHELENCVQDIHCTDSRDDEKLVENTKSRFLEDLYGYISNIVSAK